MNSDAPNIQLCPYCHSPLNEVEETKTGKKLQRCSKSRWNPLSRQTEGCLYVKWLDDTVKMLNELCPKCGEPLVLQITRRKKKIKKCSTSKWDSENLVATGCDYVEWLSDKQIPLDETCPKCGHNLIELNIKGKKLKKCSTAGWDQEFRQPTGCSYVEWIR